MKITKPLASVCRLSLCLAITLGFFQVVTFGSAKSKTASSKNRPQNALWQLKSEESIASRGIRFIAPEKYLVYGLDQNSLKAVLAQAPMEFTDAARAENATILELPTPEGKLERFRIEESPILSPELAAQYPDWKTYQAYGIDDPTASARLGVNTNGFHATILSPKGTFQIDPYQLNDRGNYITYFKKDVGLERQFHCLLDEQVSKTESMSESFFAAPEFSHGTQIRVYRLAIAATGEYTAVFGGQTAALAQVATTANRMNGVYRRDFAIGLQLVANNNLLVYTDAATDPYTNVINTAQLNANQTNIDTVIGSANYDVGHLFATSNNGLAQLSSICTSSKARGASGQPTPFGDPFDVDYVAHEIGHQIGANHTFNAANNCGSSPTGARMEAGSAVTIMGYAGICSSTANVQRNSIDTFHVYNQTEAINFINGTGSTCGTLTGNNAIPVVTAPASYTIPINTPFALTASATDANGDALTYSWEQNNAGGTGSFYPNDVDDDDTNLFTNRPLFRSYSPANSPTRTFPSMPYVLNSANEAPVTFSGTSSTGSVCAGTCITGEDLPSVARTMNFRVTVRDNKGGVADAGTTVNFVSTTAPFRVTTQNTASTWTGNTSQTVTWDVGGTNAAPVSTSNVKISMSADGGNTFPFVLHASTPNDGSETITVPNSATTFARIKIEAVGNVYFDINNVNFSVVAGPSAVRVPFDFDGDGKSDVSVFRPSAATWYLQRSQAGFSAVAFGLAADKIAPADFDGDGKTDVGVFRNGNWYYINSSNGAFNSVAFGSAGDLPRPGDFDGDTKADIAVFRPSTGSWYWLNSSNGAFNAVAFGSNGDIPLIANFDGDSKSDLAVFRPSNGGWYYLNSSNGAFNATAFGSTGDIPSVGDFDGDGKSDISVFRPSNGGWYRLNSGNGQFVATTFGTNGDVPAVGNYDGDDKSDIAVFRPSNGGWYIQQSQSGFTAYGFGTNGDTAVPNAFSGN